MVQTVSTAPVQSSESHTSPSAGKLSSKVLNRPPTPPRESTKGISSSAPESTEPEVPKTPTSSAQASSRNKKQVNWSPWTKYHKSDDPSPLRPLKSSPALSTPLKSILKPFNPSIISVGVLNPSEQIKAYTYDSFPAMLESITQALASAERSKKLDTYVTFCNTLKAYDNNPDMKAIKSKMPVLSSFIRRDLEAKLPNSANNSGDSQLISQAMKLLTFFVWLPELAESIGDDDASFFIQHAIQVLKDPSSPKVVITYFLNFLVSQKFPPKIMTPERASGIIQALKDIENRVSGNTVLAERIGIYGRFLSQAKAVMIVRTGDWMEHVLSGVLSNANNKDVRVRALHCMAEAARIIGSEKTVTRSLTNLLNREDGDGVKLFTRTTSRLNDLIKNGEGVHVTQVWGLVILLLRGKHPISSWEYFTPWLSVIQQCFNSSTVAIKVAANAAWSKLIFVLHCGPEIIPKDMDLLTRPLVRYLDPQYAASNSKGPRQAALSNVCTFLYYNIRPNALPKQLSLAWDVIVVGLIEKLVLAGKHDAEDACGILAALFDGSYQKPWNEMRGLEKEAIKAEEIVRLDPKWVRSNSAQVLRTLEVAIRKSTWEGDAAGIQLLWRKFTKCLADASMKEVKISTETMEAVANIFNMLQRFWKEGPSALINTSNKSSDKFMAIFTFLIIAAFESIGTFCFTEKLLSYDEQNAFVAISTPSNRYSSGSSFAAISHPPIVHLFQLFLKPFEGAEFSEQFFGSAQSIVAKCLEALDSRRKRLALLSACSAVLPQRGTSIIDRRAWAILATLTEGALIVKEKTVSSPTPVSWEFKDILKILHWGCRYEIPAWESLFETFAQVVQSEQGDLQLISTVIEPVAELLRLEKLDSDSHTWLIHGRAILVKAIYPKSKGQTESTIRVPYGLSSRKAANIEPYDHLYNMVNQFLIGAYNNCEGSTITAPLKNFIGALIEFINRCPKISGFVLLKGIQEGIAVWMNDQKEVMTKKNPELTAKMQGLWASVADTIRKLPRHDSITLQALATLIASGLESKRKVIVNNSIKVWNDTFGTQDALEYPPRVRIVMKKLRPIADLNLPTFPEDIDEIVPTPPTWESQESQDGLAMSQEGLAMEPPPWSSPTPGPSRHRDRTLSPMVDSMPSSSKTLLTRLREMSKGKSKARLKHMDSQLDFAPIVAESQNRIMDSQLLTEHQKEVRDRQHADAANLHLVEQSPKPYQGRHSSKVAQDELRALGIESRPLNLGKSPSLDEFVDAPENVNETQGNEGGVHAGEVLFIPETTFAVEVPGRSGREEEDPRGEQPSTKEKNNSYELPVGSEASSKHLAIRKGNEECISTKGFSTKSTQQVEDEKPATTLRQTLPLNVSASGDGEDIELIPNSVDTQNTSATSNSGVDVQSTEAQAESQGQSDNSVIEVPDSFVQDSVEGDDIRMTDSNEIEEARNQMGMLIAIEEATKKQIEAHSETEKDAGTNQPGPSKRGRKPGSSKKIKALQIRTATPQTEAENKEEEAILDCIMVTPATPKKQHAFISVLETILQKESSPQTDAPGPARPSPLSARKRKQRAELIETIPEPEPKVLGRPRKRRVTRAPMSSLVEQPVEPSQSQEIEEPNFPIPPSVSTPVKGKRRKEPTSDYSEVRRPRSTRKRALPTEEIVFDSQPEVISTPLPAAPDQGQELAESAENNSLAILSASQAKECQSEGELERNKEGEEPKNPLTRFKEVLAALAEADLTAAELREAEDEVFEVYVKLREKRRKK